MFPPPKFSHINLLITVTSVVLVQHCLSLSIMMTGPEISIGGWMENDFENMEWHTNSSPPLGNSPYPDAIVVPTSVKALSLVCNATYPVEWRFHRERWGGRSRFQYALQTTRISDGLDVIRFSSELSLFSFESNSVTGNYTCQKVGYPGLSQSYYIFWEVGSPPYLTLARSYRKPPNVPFKNDSVSFVLPCTVSVPDMVPQLTKEVGQTEEVIQKNGSVQYDPRIGFTMTNLPNPYGRYTCTGGDVDDDNEGDGDLITFNVINADDGPKPEFNESIKHGAFYNINSTSRELTCCSAGSKPPKLKLVECAHPTMCELAKHTLHTMESAKKRELGCSIITLHTLRAGVFRCVGAGIDVVREFFYPMPEVQQSPFQRGRGGKRGKGGKGKLGGKGKPGGKKDGKKKPGDKDSDDDANDDDNDGNNSTKIAPVPVTTDDPYFDWNEADSMKMILVTKLKGPLYIGQNKTFSCRVSHYYYAQGLVWGITYKNQTIQYLDGRAAEDQHPHWGPSLRHFEILHGKNHEFLDLLVTQDLQNITCYAPIWNSTEWGKKAIRFVVKMPTAPKLLGKAHKEYSWYLNDTKKSLECQFGGEPMPKIVWKKGNSTIVMNTNTVNGTSTMNFPRVTLDSDNEYKCIITNEAGTITKTFRVTVLHSASSAVSAVLILSIVGFIIVSIVAGFMFKYLRSQKTVMNHLANLAFKDVTSAANGGDNSGPNNGNTTNNAANRSPISVRTNGMILPPFSATSTTPHPISPSSASTISATMANDSKSQGSGVGTGGGGSDSRNTNGGFVFDYSTPPELESHRDGPTSPTSSQPPLSTFSSYHKF